MYLAVLLMYFISAAVNNNNNNNESKCSMFRYKITEQWDSCGMSRTWMVASIVFMEFG